MNRSGAALPSLLLVEPDTLMRRTVASVSRSLAIAQISEASTYENAELLLRERFFDGLFIAIGDDDGGLELIEFLRAGKLESDRDCPVAVMIGLCDASRAARLRTIGVRRVILKPFKIKTVLDSIDKLVAGNANAAVHA